jgi:hypothetical protein
VRLLTFRSRTHAFMRLVEVVLNPLPRDRRSTQDPPSTQGPPLTRDRRSTQGRRSTRDPQLTQGQPSTQDPRSTRDPQLTQDRPSTQAAIRSFSFPVLSTRQRVCRGPVSFPIKREFLLRNRTFAILVRHLPLIWLMTQ